MKVKLLLASLPAEALLPPLRAAHSLRAAGSALGGRQRELLGGDEYAIIGELYIVIPEGFASQKL